jgi:hypothetical protein
MRENKIVLSSSSLGAISTCMLKAWLSKQCNLTTPTESAALRVGSAAHSAMAVFLASQGDEDGANLRFEEEYRDWALENVLSDDVRSWDNTRDVFSSFLKVMNVETLPYTYAVDEVEQHIKAPLGVFNDVEVELQGYIDLPTREKATGARYILDHKFTGWLKRDTIEGFKLSAQFKCYAWLWQEVMKEPVEGVYVNACEWARLPQVRYTKAGSEYKCRTHGVGYSECRLHHYNHQLVPFTLFPEDLATWESDARDLAERYTTYVHDLRDEDPLAVLRRIPCDGTFSDGCRWCDFKRFCAGGRQRHTVETMLVAREERGEV